MKKILSTQDHSRNAFATRYVYPVVSRRSEGVSIGINLNVNNACNWRCVYCQVPNLKRGKPEHVDLKILETELQELLNNIRYGSFFEDFVPPGSRRLNDIALSGNGEPTTCPQLIEVMDIIALVKANLLDDKAVKTILITNGSLLHAGANPVVLDKLSTQNGEIWFKLDRVGTKQRKLVNDVNISLSQIRKNLSLAAQHCETWVQTCFFALDGLTPDSNELAEYLNFLEQCVESSISLSGVMVYGPARQSYQPEAKRISRPSDEWFASICSEIRGLGLKVKFTP